MTQAPPLAPTREVKIAVHDGVEIAVALYMPDGDGPFPVLIAPSPYRYDNNTLPALRNSSGARPDRSSSI